MKEMSRQQTVDQAGVRLLKLLSKESSGAVPLESTAKHIVVYDEAGYNPSISKTIVRIECGTLKVKGLLALDTPMKSARDSIPKDANVFPKKQHILSLPY